MNSGFPYLSSCDLTHVGNHRKRNEDAVLRLPDYGVFCIADGMGGLEDGKLASTRAVQALQQEFLLSRCLTSTLTRSSKRSLVGKALNRASHWIKTHASANGLSAAGTTTVVLMFDRSTPAQAFILHAGDSRVYRFRANMIARLTKDHTLAEAAGIDDDKSLPLIFRGVVTRAVGIESEVSLEETSVDVRPDDIFLLCSDGLTRMVSEPILEDLLRKHWSSDLPDLANVLVNEALRAGGIDNVSVVLVRVGQDLPEAKKMNIPGRPPAAPGAQRLPARNAAPAYNASPARNAAHNAAGGRSDAGRHIAAGGRAGRAAPPWPAHLPERRPGTFVILVLIFTINAAALCSATHILREPWSTGDDHPVIGSNPSTNEYAGLMLFGQGETFFNSACFIWLKFYQSCLSMMNTVPCPMEPSCSNYSIQAVRKHGAFKGVVLTADRLLHEIDEQRLAPMIENGTRRKYLDPVENNDFWWYTKP